MARPSKDFYPKPIDLAALDPGKPNHCDLGDGVEVVVLLRGRELRIFRDMCPHMGASMSRGWYEPERARLQCPWHGYVYDADTGAFVENPNDAIYGCLKGLYESYKPEKSPAHKLQPYVYEREGNLAYVKRPGAA